MKTHPIIGFISVAFVAALCAPANAQYIARKLQRAEYSVSASGISGNRVVGGNGSSPTRNRYQKAA